MKQKIKLLSTVVIFLLVVCKAKAQVTAQDGRTYKTVKIGNQEWMAENLNVSIYRNGDSISQFQDNGKKMTFKKNVGWTSAFSGAWCFYETDKEIDTTFGKLYNGFAVRDPRGLAPDGWHIPTSDDWRQLAETLGGKDEAGAKMKSTEGWEDNGNGTNESGFTGFPVGWRTEKGDFRAKGSFGYWWSSTKRIGDQTFVCYLNKGNNKFHFGTLYYLPLFGGAAVRCVKD